MEVTLKLTERQAQVVLAALDLYTRVLIGQTENVEEVLRDFYWKRENDQTWYKVRDFTHGIKHVLWGFLSGASYGIHSREVHDDARKAYDLQQVIRHAVAWKKRPEGGIQVCFDEPRQTSETEPLATVNVQI